MLTIGQQFPAIDSYIIMCSFKPENTIFYFGYIYILAISVLQITHLSTKY